MHEEIARFVAEQCRTGTELRVTRSEIYEAFLRWCFTEGSPELTTWQFCAGLRALGFKDIRISQRGGTGFGWLGLALYDSPEKDDWRIQMARFFRERCFIEDSATVDKSKLYENYVAWCGTEKIEPKNQRQLGTELRRLYPEVRRTNFSRKDHRSHPGWRGVGLRSSKSLRL